MSTLTEKVVLDRSKARNLGAVRNLNVWGCRLMDISIVAKLSNLEVLNLSCNNIRTLKDLQFCHKLTELYLRKNQLEAFGELQYLAGLQNLKILWLSDNPLSHKPGYEENVSRILPQVTKLDNVALRGNKSSGKEQVLQAVLLLLGELGKEELTKVQGKVSQLLQ